jgi:peptidoglycan/xylan/chitin deacetylase (PgdA/CDA1 family)
LELSLKGDGIVTLEYGSEYAEAGVGVRLLCDGMPVPEEQIPEVIVDSLLDTGKTGTYVITYIVVFDTGRELLRAQAERTVHIVDTQAPVINLVTDPNGFTYPGHTYVEEGYTAIDGYDGDITAQVERTEENGIVTYRVSDAAGNETVVTRAIRYDDPICPELTLQGENPTVIKIGKDYAEPGYEAMDGCDGDLTQQVTATGEINKWIPGSYVITYTVQDAAGNVTTAERTVIVEHVKNGNVIYLTFDDGPRQHTPRLLEILDKYQVKATFFVVNTEYIRYVDDIVKKGHSIGLHCSTHDYKKIYASEEAYFEDLENIRDIVYKRTGVYTNLIRFPGGSSNTVSKFNPGIMTRLTKLVEKRGYHYFDWNVSSGDAGSVFTADAVYDRVTKGCKNRKNSIVLQHDTKGFSVDAVERIIQWGLENGYTFLPLDENSPKSHHAIFN